jgi:hypothetical protein
LVSTQVDNGILVVKVKPNSEYSTLIPTVITTSSPLPLTTIDVSTSGQALISGLRAPEEQVSASASTSGKIEFVDSELGSVDVEAATSGLVVFKTTQAKTCGKSFEASTSATIDATDLEFASCPSLRVNASMSGRVGFGPSVEKIHGKVTMSGRVFVSSNTDVTKVTTQMSGRVEVGSLQETEAR